MILHLFVKVLLVTFTYVFQRVLCLFRIKNLSVTTMHFLQIVFGLSRNHCLLSHVMTTTSDRRRTESKNTEKRNQSSH